MYHNRDLSWLGFNERVLHEAADPTVPLLERLKFLSIFSSNLDEFFGVRFPAIIALSALGGKYRKLTIPPTDKHLGKYVKEKIRKQLNRFGEILRQEIIPGLAAHNIILYYNQTLQPAHASEVRELLLSKILSFIQPIFIREDFDENFIPENDRLYFVISLKQQNSSLTRHAVVNIPSKHLPRFFELSPINDNRYIIFIDDIIRENMACIFPGFDIQSASSFKISRDMDLRWEDDFGDDVLKAIEKKLVHRESGKVSRFLYENDMPQSLRLYLKSVFNFRDEESFEGGRYHNLKDLAALPVNNKDLLYPELKPIQAAFTNSCGEIFDHLRQRDVLLHFPYHSYNPVLSFFNQAAIDPDVRSIQITLYRVAAQSHIVNALISAAKNGKSVVVFVELKARFDEANNIRWSKEMKKAGIKLIYSLPQVKVHSKIALIEKKHQSYAMIGTGNFNENTARFYADHALLTSDAVITKDLRKLFYFLQSPQNKAAAEQMKPEVLLVSRVNMVNQLEKMIKEQMALAKKGLPALLRIKLNSLEDFDMIQLLYKAAAAGVQVRLIVRGISCIVAQRTGKGSIEVKRIVDRYLEHSRIYIFGAGEDKKIYIGSADWMSRNLHHRIEVCVPVKDASLQEQLLQYFELQWNDNVKAVNIDENNEQHYPTPSNGQQSPGSQLGIYAYLKQNDHEMA